jgi:hypothetical protein
MSCRTFGGGHVAGEVAVGWVLNSDEQRPKFFQSTLVRRSLYAQGLFGGMKRKNAIYASRMKRQFDESFFEMVAMLCADIENFTSVSTM